MTTLQQLQQELKALSDKVEKALSEQQTLGVRPYVHEYYPPIAPITFDTQPQPVWERYPTFESCRVEEETEGYIIASNKGVIMPSLYRYGFPTEALAKYARAVMILSTIAKKWNDGVEKGEDIYFAAVAAYNTMYVDTWSVGGTVDDLLPFYFHSEELCAKSIELFPQEWQDFFNAKNG